MNSLDALTAASAELQQANQARESLLFTLRSAAGAQVNFDDQSLRLFSRHPATLFVLTRRWH